MATHWRATMKNFNLSWAQIVWAVAVLASVLSAWYDTRGQIALLRQEIGFRVVQAEAERDRMWKAIDDAAAAERPKPRR